MYVFFVLRAKNESIHLSAAMSASASASGSFEGIGGGVSAGYSQEQSVSAAKEMESSQDGSVMMTTVKCYTSKIHMVSFKFHPQFLAAIAKALDVPSMLAVVCNCRLIFVRLIQVLDQRVWKSLL